MDKTRSPGSSIWEQCRKATSPKYCGIHLHKVSRVYRFWEKASLMSPFMKHLRFQSTWYLFLCTLLFLRHVFLFFMKLLSRNYSKLSESLVQKILSPHIYLPPKLFMSRWQKIAFYLFNFYPDRVSNGQNMVNRNYISEKWLSWF